MYARVARWEGGEGEAMRRFAERIKSEPGPPEGVPAKKGLILIDPEHGRSMGVIFFETEEDMRSGDAKLNSMSPDQPGMGNRTAVEFYEVGAELSA